MVRQKNKTQRFYRYRYRRGSVISCCLKISQYLPTVFRKSFESIKWSSNQSFFFKLTSGLNTTWLWIEAKLFPVKSSSSSFWRSLNRSSSKFVSLLYDKYNTFRWQRSLKKPGSKEVNLWPCKTKNSKFSSSLKTLASKCKRRLFSSPKENKLRLKIFKIIHKACL